MIAIMQIPTSRVTNAMRSKAEGVVTDGEGALSGLRVSRQAAPMKCCFSRKWSEQVTLGASGRVFLAEGRTSAQPQVRARLGV